MNPGDIIQDSRPNQRAGRIKVMGVDTVIGGMGNVFANAGVNRLQGRARPVGALKIESLCGTE